MYAYARVSHQSSADSGLSVENQVQLALNYATVIPEVAWGAQSNCGIPGVFVDRAVSGWKKSFHMRPAGRELNDLLQRGDHIICYSIDRLARNLRDFCNTTYDWANRGISVHYIHDQINTATAIGKMQASMRATMAQYASDLISERTREATAIRRMRAGKPVGVCGRKRKLWVPSPWVLKDDSTPAGRPTGKVYTYTRVSTDRQYISMLGLEAQEASVEKYAKRLMEETGSQWGGSFSDPAVSAYRTDFHDRPAGKQLMELLQPGDDIVIYRVDRAWRSTRNAGQMQEALEKKGAYVHFVSEGIRTDKSSGTEWLSVLASLAEMESRIRSRRVRESIDALRKKGRPVGKIPKGYKVSISRGQAKLHIDEKSSRWAAAVWIMHNELDLGWTKISDKLHLMRCTDMGIRHCLKNRKANNPKNELDRALRLKDSVPETLWQKFIDGAWERYSYALGSRSDTVSLAV